MAAAEGRCPSENTVVELLDADLAPARRAEISDHVDRCGRCRELVAVIAKSESVASDPDPGRLRARASEPAIDEAVGHPQPGARLGRYRIEEKLGEGGMGVVHAAYDPALDRRVAIKVIRPGFAETSQVVAARLLREARALAQISHANIVAVHDVGQVGGLVFVAMELVPGGTLRDWLAAERRSWRQVLEVFRSAGEGLVAAHAAKLIHRDFKPDNVLIDPRGHVRITDFGLARALAGGDADHAGAQAAGEERETLGGERALPAGVALTRTGAVVGTPRYMAPEQHASLPTDERTDQFSFCVALWEALYGERPFAGETPVDLGEAVIGGRLRPVPLRPRTPEWLRRLLLRGLQVRPDDRFPSMRALLDAIRPLRSPRRLGAVALAASLALAGGWLGLASALGIKEDSAAIICTGDDSRMVSVWNPDRRRAVGARLVLAGGKTASAEARWKVVERTLDDYARDWSRMRAELCEARERGDQAGELIDLRSHCLETRMAELQYVLGLLDTDDPVVAKEAIGAADALPSIARCSAVEQVETRTPVPTDPEVRAQVEKLRRELVHADTLREAGRFRESRALLEPLHARAVELGYRPFIADVLYYLGALQVSTGSAAQGEATVRRAAHAAEASRYDELAAYAWLLLIDTATQATGDLAKAAEYAEHARAALDRLGTQTRLEALYEHQVGILDWSRSRPNEAIAHYSAARRLFERLGDKGMVLAADVNTALVYKELGKFDEALRLTRQVLQEQERLLGPDHPDTAVSLWNLAGIRLHQGHADDALVEMRKALAVRERVNGPLHADTGRLLSGIGEALSELGRYEEALVHHRRAVAILEGEYGPDHQDVANALVNMAGIHVELGHEERALPDLRRALAIFLATLGDTHLQTLRARLNLADALREAGRFDQALVLDQEAMAAMMRGVGPDNLYAPYAHLGMGLDLVGLGRLVDAIAPLEVSVELFARIGNDPVSLARGQFALARALWPDRRSRPRAKELAGAALKGLAGTPGESGPLRRALAAWLGSRSR